MKRLSSKLAAFLLVAVMVVSLFPAAVFAEDTDVEESDTSSTTFSAYAVDEAEDIQEELELPDETDPETVVPDLNAEAFYQEYTVGDLKVTVSYEVGTVPEGTEVVVSVAKPEAIEAVKADAEEDINVVGADISFVFEGKEIEPKDFSDKKVTVALEYAGEEDLSGQYFETLHVNETLDENGEVVYSVEPIEATMTDIVETVTKYTEVPVYETREITEERTTMVTKTREVEKTKTVKVKVKVKWYDPSTWTGYKYETQKYMVTETYEEPITETVVVGTEEVQVGTETVEDGTEEIVVGQTTVFEADDFSTFTITWGNNNGSTVTIHHGYMNEGSFVEFPTGSSTNTNYPTSLRWSDYDNNDYAVLIYDFKDYAYSATYYRTNTSSTPATGGTAIWPALQKRNDNWRYCNATRTSWNRDGACANNSHIYVIYTPKTITEGYSPSSGGDDPGTPTPTPSFTPDVGKTVTDQKADGTYDITLGFVGNKEDEEVKTTARVIVVFDLSGSMEEDISGDMPTYTYWNGWGWVTDTNPDFDGTSRLTLAKNAVNKLAETLLDLHDSQGNKLVEMGLVTFATDGRIRTFGTGTNASNFTSDYATYSGVVSNLPISSNDDLGTGINDIGRGTNWEKGLNLANSMTTSTAGKTYIIFVSDGDPTYRVSRGNYSDSQLASERAIDNRVKTPIFGSGNSNYDGNYDTAKEVAKSIVDHNKVLYTVGLSSDATRMTNLATYAGGTYKPGDDADEFAESLADIASAVTSEIGLTDVTITDGVTSMSQIETQSLIGTAGNFVYNKSYPLTQTDTGYTYTIGETSYNVTQAQVDAGTDGTHKIFARQVGSTTVYYVEYPWTGDNVPEAEIDSNNSVVWDTSDANDELEHGVYYSVSFTVWPKQEAYDLIADLDNKIRKVTDTDLADGTKAQLRILVNNTTYEYVYDPETQTYSWTGGLTDAQMQALIEANDAVFSMKTNTGLSASYKYGGVDMPTATYTNYTNGSMSLDDTSINIKKTWNNYMDAREASDVTLTITRTDEEGTTKDYFHVAMGEPEEVETTGGGKQWIQEPEDDLYISLGVMSVNGDAVTIREKGYDYTVVEPENFSYRWDLSADIYHPMVINGTTTVLIEVQDTAGLPDEVKNLAQNKTITSGGLTYYAFEGKLYVTKTGENLLVLEATNDRRSNLIINKAVDEEDAPADDLFPVQVTLRNPNDPLPGEAGYSNWYHTMWFYVSTASNDRNTIVLDDIEVSDNVTPETSELRTDDTHITDIVTHEADDSHPYPYITYKYDGTLNTVKAVDLELHTGTETVIIEGAQVEREYTYYSYYTGFYWFDNGATATVKIKDGWYINFNNMGKDTTYTIVEPTADMPDGYTLDKVTTSAENTQGEAVTPGTVSGNTVTGTIEKPNSDFKATYDNKYEGVFYVYHSGNNDVVRYPMATDGVKYSADKTFDIFGKTIATTFYGGYFNDYVGKSSGFDAAALDYEEDAATHEYVAKDTNGTAYTYTYIKDSNRAAWDDGTAYTDSGKAMVPVVNTVYYLKEVPTYYLLPYSQYTYNKTDKVIRNIWYISAIDDLHYQKAGFFVETIAANGETDAIVVDTLTVTNSSGGATVTLSPKSVFGNKGGAGNGVQAGYLGYWDAKAKIAANATSKFTPFWITPDGIYVNGDYTRTIKFNNGKVGTGGMRTTDTETESNYPMID